MARRGRPRKAGARQPDGSLRSNPSTDKGHILILAHRAAVIAGADPHDSFAGYPLGILALRGEIDSADHEAGLKYAGLHAVVFGGSNTPRSHLASAIGSLGGVGEVRSELSDDDRRTILRRCEKALREAVAHILLDGKRPLSVLENVVIYETAVYGQDAFLGRRDHKALTGALDRLCRLWNIERPKAAA